MVLFPINIDRKEPVSTHFFALNYCKLVETKSLDNEGCMSFYVHTCIHIYVHNFDPVEV